jgi:hypothetical protein
VKPVPRFNTGDSERKENEIDEQQQLALQATYDLVMEKLKMQLYIGANSVEDHLKILAPAIRGIFAKRLEKVFPNIKIRNFWDSMQIHPTHPTHPNMLETEPANQRVLQWLLH